jgi:phenylpyruvate tautomerase PptA (4-oxalocrotonate tautomerase family)
VTAAAVRALGRLKGATAVVVSGREAGTWRPILRPLGTPAERDGVLVYRLRGPELSC